MPAGGVSGSPKGAGLGRFGERRALRGRGTALLEGPDRLQGRAGRRQAPPLWNEIGESGDCRASRLRGQKLRWVGGGGSFQSPTYKAGKSGSGPLLGRWCRAMLWKTAPLLALVGQVLVLENGLLRRPPMGWLAWERFRCNIDCEEDPENCISERLFMEMADRLAQDGWRDLGYTYLNIDDCWIGGRDAKGHLMPSPKRFPNGIAFLADYAHSLGLQLGIYEDLGNFTCMGFPGTTLDKVVQDAQTFAEWKVDMLKLDGCYSTPEERAKGYPMMAAALNATGRPIAFSCSWPAYEGGLPPKVNYSQLAEICNLWRNYDDIQDSWSSVLSILDWFVDHQDILQPVAGPGHWNDPDMLLIGNFGLSFEQARAQMALWTVLAAPLFISTDLRTISAQNMDILQNPLMIKINQDPLGIQGRRILKPQDRHAISLPLLPLPAQLHQLHLV
ncbi:alpha-N-acetylgalactosaminidase isoform X4 [Myotis myotis]|uniref:alpha-N-acetylgalactosaminidase isoform X4 n=1 Tax=Myotis myotis TaxID=51298 RepID=UPI00174DADFA|nr:alpha-N-acetylgalactosaminidase isoform X4 [Myotis myotis]